MAVPEQTEFWKGPSPGLPGPSNPHRIPTSCDMSFTRSGGPSCPGKTCYYPCVLWAKRKRQALPCCCPVWVSQPLHLTPTLQEEAKPGSEQVSLATMAVLPTLSTWTSRHDSSRAWDRPHHGQGALLGKLRSPQPHPLSPAVLNPPHTEQDVGSSGTGCRNPSPHLEQPGEPQALLELPNFWNL